MHSAKRFPGVLDRTPIVDNRALTCAPVDCRSPQALDSVTLDRARVAMARVHAHPSARIVTEE